MESPDSPSTYNGKKVTSIGYHTFARTNLKIIYCEADSRLMGGVESGATAVPRPSFSDIRASKRRSKDYKKTIFRGFDKIRGIFVGQMAAKRLTSRTGLGYNLIVDCERFRTV